MLIKNIKWDTDGDMEALASLPTEVYTPPHFYIRNSMTISKNSSMMSRTGSRTNMDGAISDSRRKPMMEELSNATRCPNEAERKKYHESRNQICHNEKRSQGIYVHLQR